jgi:hypothetical protein
MIIKLKNGTEFQFMDKPTMGVFYALLPLKEKIALEAQKKKKELKLQSEEDQLAVKSQIDLYIAKIKETNPNIDEKQYRESMELMQLIPQALFYQFLDTVIQATAMKAIEIKNLTIDDYNELIQSAEFQKLLLMANG